MGGNGGKGGGKPGKGKHILSVMWKLGVGLMRKALLHGYVLAFTLQSVCHCTMDDVHNFEGVYCIPIEVARDKKWEWVSAGWLSKQMAHFGCSKKKPTEIGLSVTAGLGLLHAAGPGH